MEYTLRHWHSYHEDEWWRQWANAASGELSLLAAWHHDPEKWRRLLGEQVEKLLGWEQPSVQPQVELLGQKDAPGFSLQKVAVEADDGTWMTGYVCVPHDNQQPLPAVVLAHDAASSKEAMVGLLTEHNPEKAPGSHLAASGYVVCCMDPRGAGERPRSSDIGDLWQWLGKPPVGRDAMDLVMARKMLAERPDVTEQRIGIVGMGSGGMAALYASIMDEGFRATAICGCLMRYRSLPLQATVHQRRVLHERLANSAVPGLLAYADFEDLACLVAPRPLCVCQGADAELPHELATDVASRITEGFEVMGEKAKLTVEVTDQPVVYPTAEVLRFLDDWLLLPV
ncbi:MAG: hypothetical protein GX358_09295 [candidate division WS1 bacterium]|mgnify:CR=1 FL=1|jgi:dienelactone hydrolase|nr:hypothetical protein [candidate division WS1 bacterium]